MAGDLFNGLVDIHKEAFTESMDDIAKYVPYKDVIDDLLALDEMQRAERQRVLSKSGIQEQIDISRLSRAQLNNLKIRIESGIVPTNPN